MKKRRNKKSLSQKELNRRKHQRENSWGVSYGDDGSGGIVKFTPLKKQRGFKMEHLD